MAQGVVSLGPQSFHDRDQHPACFAEEVLDFISLAACPEVKTLLIPVPCV
jgi:hypothetical protein